MKTYIDSNTNNTSGRSTKVIRGSFFTTLVIVKKIIIPVSTFSVNELIDTISRIYIILLTTLGLLFLNISATTAQTLQWERHFNGPSNLLDEAAKVKTDASGNVYVTGTSQSDILTVKYNAAGVQQWNRRYNITYLDYHDYMTYSTIDKATDLQVDASGNIYVTGLVYYSTAGEFGTKVITIKYNPSGTILWENVSVAPYTAATDLQDPRSFIDGAGNIYTTVSYYALGEGNVLTTSKMTSAGADLWTVYYDATDFKVTAHAIHVDGTGNVYVTGGIDQMNGNYLTLKYNSAGVFQWQRQYNGPSGGKDEAVKVKTDPAGNVYVTGTSKGTSPNTTDDILTIKYNSAGTQLWTARHNTPYNSDDLGPYNSDDEATDLQVDASGNTYVSGASYYINYVDRVEVITIKYNTSGVKQWQIINVAPLLTQLSQVDGPHSTFDGSGLYITAAYRDHYSSPREIIVEKISLIGTVLWERRFTATGGYDVAANAIHVDSPGNVYVTGKIDQSNGNYLTLKYAAQQTFRINSGGPAVRTTMGSFTADAYLTGSSTVSSSTAAIAGTTDDALYQNYRRGNVARGSFGYNIPIVNGRYNVRLHFAETYFTAPNKRKFNVTAEGAVWLSNYDIAADGGVKTAKVKSRIVTITDGSLTLNFTSVLDYALVCAIEVIPAPAATARESAEGVDEEVKTENETEVLTSLQAYPNPFTEKITLSFSVLQNSPVRVEVYSMQGSLVEGLFNEEAEAGRTYDIEWKAANQPAGMYVIRLATGTSVSTKKVVLVK